MIVAGVGRLADLYRRTLASQSALALVAANAISLAGVLFFGWSLWTILVLYWLENGIVGFWNVVRILTARGSLLGGATTLPSLDPTASDDRAAALQAAARSALAQGLIPGQWRSMGAFGRVAIATFFSLHYGIFWLVHGLFVFALPTFASFGVPTLSDRFVGGLPVGPFGELGWSSIWLGAGALFLSHGASFLLNDIRRGEYRTASPLAYLFAPYGRVVVLHLTILFGAFAVAFLGAPIVLLVILVMLKTTLDLQLHLRQRRRFGGIGAAAGDPSAGPASAWR